MTTRTIRETERCKLFEHFPAGYYAVFDKETKTPSHAFGTEARDELLEMSDDDFNFNCIELAAS